MDTKLMQLQFRNLANVFRPVTQTGFAKKCLTPRAQKPQIKTEEGSRRSTQKKTRIAQIKKEKLTQMAQIKRGTRMTG